MTKRTALPPAIIPFILENLDGFDIALEDDDRIVITPKQGAMVNPNSRAQLASLILENGETRAARPIPLRPKFSYRPFNKNYTPQQAKAFGMSKPRLRVYEVIYAAGADGARYKEIRAKTQIPHGSVQQILNWLRKQKLIIGVPESS